MSYAAWSVVFGEQPSAAKWNILGTNDAYFDSVISRFVAIDPGVVVVNAVDPANTNWTSVDITANTSATATAVLLHAVGTSTDTTRHLYLRTTGSGDAQDSTTTILTTQVANVQVHNTTAVKLDASQSFDYSVSNANMSAVTLVVRGYWETVA
ncbi:MAG: hypothetical protein EPO02_13560 [Nitrospirae bacterium]|nr:MAG: hypothetical protein EPO02_13560 [Nitrospirota bacterium]